MWEWNEQIGIGSGGADRGIRGGSWIDNASFLAASLPDIIAFPSVENGSIGFRVASLVPEPHPSLLAAAALATLVAVRKRSADAARNAE